MKDKPVLVEADIVHECVLVETTEKIGEGSIKMLSTWIVGPDILAMVDINSTKIDRYLEELRKHRFVKKLDVLYKSGNNAKVLLSMTYYSTVVEGIQKSKSVLLEPTITEGGVDKVTLLTPSEKHMRLFFDTLKDTFDIKIKSKKYLLPDDKPRFDFFQTTGFMKFKTIFEQLTPRQREVFEIACKAGYYNTPKRITLTELAQTLGLSESTFREHLRKAESKLLPTFTEVLKLFK
jgi:predicted DNA binding protein